VELLNSSKWPNVNVAVAESADGEDDDDDDDDSDDEDYTTGDAEEEDDDEEDDEDDEDLVDEEPEDEDEEDSDGFAYFFDGATSLTRQDVQVMLHAVNASGLSSTSPDTIIGDIETFVKDSTVSSAVFDRLLATIKPSEVLQPRLTHMFQLLDKDSESSVPLRDIQSAFLMLVQGSKSDKLVAAFNLFDGDSDGALTKAELSRFLATFLATLVSMSSSVSSAQVPSLRPLLQETVDEVATLVMEDREDPEGRVTFPAFGAWYNEGGFDKIPWLELLDVSKWSRM